MCCFSGTVQEVGGTKIFARKDGNVQHLVYSMSVEMDSELAMILPIPTVKGSGEDAVKFVDLSEYEDFFKDVENLFPQMWSKGLRGFEFSNDSLSVQRVGSFDASFVPSLKDFSRLDKRFTIPKSVWDKMPQYADYGFAVFKLRPGEDVHPMAFSFPTRYVNVAFFPTVHVHDGEFHGEADFDHTLYVQYEAYKDWKTTSETLPDDEMIRKSQGILSKAEVCKKVLRGSLPNKDTLCTIS